MEFFKMQTKPAARLGRIFLSVIMIAATMSVFCCSVVFADSNDAVSVNLRNDTTGASSNQILISETNIGGKKPADNSEILGLSGNTEGRREYAVPNGANATFTVEANIYADGGAKLCFTEIYGGEVFTWNPDGSVTLGNGYDSSRQPVPVDGKSFSRGRWHKAAMTYDSSTQEFSLWCDGVALGNWRRVWGADKVGFGMLPSDESGKALFDNIKYYEGTYRAAFTVPTLTVNSENAHEDNGIVYYGDMNTVAELAAAIEADAAYFNIWNRDMTAVAGETDGIESGMMIVLVSDDDTCAYYPIMKQQLTLDRVEFTGGDGYRGAKAVVINGFSSPKSVLMIMVLKNAGGEIEKVRTSEPIIFEGTREIEIAPEAIAEGDSAEVFFLESWENMIMSIDGIVKQ